MSEVNFFYLEPVSILKQRNQLKAFLQKTAKQAGRPNFTDIITFDLSESKKGGIAAEIYISYDRVKDNAKQMKTPISKELHRVIFHGLLHLLGYKDKLKKDQIRMREMEDKLLTKYFC